MYRKTVLLSIFLTILVLVCTAPVSADRLVSTFSELEQAVSDGVETIYVTEDIEMQPLRISDGADITLKPSGKPVVLSFAQMSGQNSDPAGITIYSGGRLTLSGSDGHSLTIRGSADRENTVPLIDNRKGGNLTLESGAVLRDHVSGKNYAGVNNNGRFVMTGGLITNIEGNEGGAVSLVNSGSVFVLSGGEIRGNRAEAGGDGIYVGNGACLTLLGGTVLEDEILVRGATPSNTVISLSGPAVVSAIHFQNSISGSTRSVPAMQVSSDFTGEVRGISYTDYQTETVTASFPSAEAAAAKQTQFTLQDSRYQLTLSGNTLAVGMQPGVRLVFDEPQVTAVPGDTLSFPLSLEVADRKVSSLVISASAEDEQGNPVSLQYEYTVNGGAPFSVAEQTENRLTLSTGTDITADIRELCVLTIQNTRHLKPDALYRIRLSVESFVSNAEDYTRYPHQYLEAEVRIVPVILDETANINAEDRFGLGIWSFAEKAAVTYVISPYTASLEKPWPTVSRNLTPFYSRPEAELADVFVYKSAEPYTASSANIWLPAASTVSRNPDGTIRFVKSAEDADAQCFKLVFTGRKLGDVVEGTGDMNQVNLYDVDMILHAAVDSSRYIKPVWRPYADIDSDGKIQLSDAMLTFAFLKGF